MTTRPVSNRSPLPEPAFLFLPLGSVKPRGWLKKQLRIQADGQTGHLPEFWPDLGPNSGWLGGDGEAWERGPYYLDGLVPLAHLLDDKELIGRANEWLEWMLNSQDEYGHFGPKSLDDWWPFGVALKVLTQHQEATGCPRVVPVMERFLSYMARELPHRPLHSWGKMRWADTVLSIVWLYNRNGDPKLLDLAREIMSQGYDWSWHFRDFAHTEKQALRFPMRTHVVNTAMGVKTPGVQWMLLGWPEHRDGVTAALGNLDEFHGQATGIFTGDEHLAGKNPTQGTETCAVVELMFSLENLIRTLGDPSLADRLEKVTYNALPAAFTADTWGHQYDQQANQVLCTIAKRRLTNNGDDAVVFGLEPNFGCCTANQHQGWPKFVASMWMATPDGGLAAVAHGPCEVQATCGGQPVTVTVETDYPFAESIHMTVSTPAPTTFPLSLRIPGWCAKPRLSVNGEPCDTQPGAFSTVMREWSDGDTVDLELPMEIAAERRYHDAITVTRGPLVYSLRVGERWERIRGKDPCPDYAVHPTTPWNYGLAVDPDDPQLKVAKKGFGELVFGPDCAPIELKAMGRRLPEWQLEDNQAGPLPQSPVRSEEPEEELTLVPYGCAKLRVTELPLLDR